MNANPHRAQTQTGGGQPHILHRGRTILDPKIRAGGGRARNRLPQGIIIAAGRSRQKQGTNRLAGAAISCSASVPTTNSHGLRLLALGAAIPACSSCSSIPRGIGSAVYLRILRRARICSIIPLIMPSLYQVGVLFANSTPVGIPLTPQRVQQAQLFNRLERAAALVVVVARRCGSPWGRRSGCRPRRRCEGGQISSIRPTENSAGALARAAKFTPSK